MSEEDLQNADNWDLEHAEKRPPVKKARAVVSVAFSADDFDRVAEVAERIGMKTSEFIREATLNLVHGSLSHVDFVMVVGDQEEQLYVGELKFGGSKPPKAVAANAMQEIWATTAAAATS